MANMVLVVDMLRGFLEPGHNLYCGGYARAIIPNVQRLLEDKIQRSSRVVFIHDTHAADDLESQMFPVHCVKGTAETELVPALAGYSEEHLEKNRYGAFYDTDLAQRLGAMKHEKVIVCGVCTDICVLHTVADARNQDYPVDVPVDCVPSFDTEAHHGASAHGANPGGSPDQPFERGLRHL